jgi:PAS domain S-box-containing protein
MTRILIADDNPQNLYLLESILKGYRFEVTSAKNGAEALDAALKNPPDLIISDILMPVMDGFELCRKWKVEERLKHIPFLFYTATYIDPKDEQFAKNLGADRFLVKPQKPEFLLQTVREVLEEAQQKAPVSPAKPLGDEMEVLRQYSEVLFRKLEKKVMDLEGEITERRHAQEKLRASEIFLNNIVEQIPDMIFVKDARELRFVRINKAGEELLGCARDVMYGKNDHDFFPKTESEFFIEKDREVLRSKQLLDIPEEMIKTRHKGERILHTKKIPIFDESGNPQYLLGISEDITDRKRAEEKLHQSKIRYRKLYDSMIDAFLRVDISGQIQEYNHSFSEMLGYSDEELITLAIQDLTPEKWLAFENYIVETQILPRGYSDVYEKEFRKKDGTVVPVELRTTLIRDDTGQADGMWAIVRDITDRKQAAEKINLSNRKLALMTDVTYQDIQNKVTGLRGYIELFKETVSEQDRAALLKKEEAVLETIHNLIKNTKEYQQMGMDKFRWIPLEQTIQMQFSLISQKQNVTLDCDLHGLEIYSVPLIDRVFYNLMQNAIKHGKTLTRISFSCQETSDGLVLICEDDGVGIPFEQKPHIFDRVVGGVGKFGLFFVHEFLGISGMIITETGEPGKGARFQIAVPKEGYRFAGKA